MLDSGRLISSCSFPLSSPAHWLHGDIIALQLHRGPAAPLLGQCPKVLRPAQLPWWHRPAAGNSLSLLRLFSPPPGRLCFW